MTGRLVRQYHQKRPLQKRPPLRGSPACAFAFWAAPHFLRLHAAFALALAASLTSGCAVSIPIALSNASKADADATGSVPASALERLLDPEDWRRARAALSTALDPQGNGSLVSWDNPQSGAKGSFVPVGKAYPSDAKICRGFKTVVDWKITRTMQGIACASKDGDWTIAEMAPATPGAGEKSASAR